MNLDDLQTALGITLQDTERLELAMCHRSAAEEGLASGYNERLEYLGDAVLKTTITAEIFQRFPSADEGAMSRIRAQLIRNEFLAELARELNLGALLVLGKGEEPAGRDKDSLLANAFEAMLGAVFLEAGFQACQSIVASRFEGALDSITDAGTFKKHPKSELQELCVKMWRLEPKYREVEKFGPPHDLTFVWAVDLDGKEVARGSGRKAKAAQTQAAERALVALAQENN
ncbi:MAG: ribonuclease III [Myxococcota bacterium]|nr:ribonuclease III [Myxococcota bacterium]